MNARWYFGHFSIDIGTFFKFHQTPDLWFQNSWSVRNVMAPLGITIYRLSEKLQVAQALLSEISDRGSKIRGNSMSALAEGLGVSPQVLSEAAGKGRLSLSIVSALSTLCGFEMSDPRWRDPAVDDKARAAPVGPKNEYKGKDTVEAFTEMIVESLTPRRGRMQHYDYLTFDSDLLEFEVDGGGQDTDLDDPLFLFLRLDLELARPNRTVTYGFKQIKIRLLPDRDSSMVFHAFATGDIELTDAKLLCHSSSAKPSWTIVSRNAALQGSFNPDRPLVRVADVMPNDTIFAEISVNTNSEDFLFVETEGDLEAETEKVIEALLRTHIDGARESESGWKVLAHHKIRLRVKPKYHAP